ncbi:ATP-binding protein [Jiulongibacter sp. NS-SX5]|uniref:ATP-binding protein n=1 Tax=Jiulongibacter sp. NS-SX5 TaxID=3463854 RepID=UPI00405A3E5E
MKKISLLFFWLCFFKVAAQNTPEEWDHYISSIKYLDIANKDSIPHWSAKLAASGYPRAEAYALRLKGFYADFEDNRSEALDWYLRFLEASRELQNPDDELSAVSDLVYTYLIAGQHLEAKNQIMQLLARYEPSDFSPKRLAVIYNNLGQCYLKEQKSDSALVYYNRSLKIKEDIGDMPGIANSKINLAALYVRLENFNEGLKLSNDNLEYLKNEPSTDLWYNLINKAGALHGLGRNIEAEKVLLNAMQLADSLDFKMQKERSHNHLSVFYYDNGDFKKAYEELLKSNELQNELLNEQTADKIAELQEAYNAKEREQENELLSAQLEAQKNRQLLLLIGVLALALLAGIIGFAYQKNRKKNALILSQNEKLTQLNSEKNHLMSVVSHDLSSPFSAIKLWAQNLSESSKNDLKESEEMILKTADFGLKTIQSILTIDKDEMHPVRLEKVDLALLFKDLVSRFKPLADTKKIDLKVRVEQDLEELLTDRSLLFRALENLLSNAVKYSEAGTEVILRSYEQNNFLCFEIKDQGSGIEEQELKTLFDRYKTTSNQTTAGEQSFGLGLSIVHRIAGELGGKIEVQSTPGQGSVFTLFVPV